MNSQHYADDAEHYRVEDSIPLAKLLSQLSGHRTASLLSLLLSIWLLFWPEYSSRGDNFVIYLPGGPQVIQLQILDQVPYLPLIQTLNVVGKVSGLQEKRDTLRVFFGATQIDFKNGDRKVKVNKGTVALQDPARVVSGQWLVSRDFVTIVLPLLTRQPIEYQLGMNRVFVGQVRPCSFNVRLDHLNNGTRLTLQFSDKISVRTASSNGKWILYVVGPPVEPLQQLYRFQDSAISDLTFNDQDGVPKLILSPAAPGLNFYPSLVEDGKVLVVDVVRPPAAVVQAPPAAPVQPGVGQPPPGTTPQTVPPGTVEESPAVPPGPPLPVIVLDPMSNGGTGPDALPKLHQQAARRQAVERRGKRVLADRVVDDRHALAAGELLARARRSSRACRRSCARSRWPRASAALCVASRRCRSSSRRARAPTGTRSGRRRRRPRGTGSSRRPCSGYVCRNRYWTVSPFSISVAASRSAMPSGSLHQPVGRASRAPRCTRRAGRRNTRRGRPPSPSRRRPRPPRRRRRPRAPMPDGSGSLYSAAAVIGVDVVEADRGVAHARLAGTRARRRRLPRHAGLRDRRWRGCGWRGACDLSWTCDGGDGCDASAGDRAKGREAGDGQQQRAGEMDEREARRRSRTRRAAAAAVTSAEKVENVVRPPRKPVTTNSRHFRRRGRGGRRSTRRRSRRGSRRSGSPPACRAETAACAD